MIKTLPFFLPVTITTSGTPMVVNGGTPVAVGSVTPNPPGAPGVRLSPLLMKRIEFRPLAGNSGTVSIACKLASNGAVVNPIILAAGAFPLVVEADPHTPIDLNDFFFDASANGQIIQIIGIPYRR